MTTIPSKNMPSETINEYNLTPAEQSILIIRSVLLVHALRDLSIISAEIQNLKYQQVELGYEQDVARSKLRQNIEHKTEQYRFAKNSLKIHENNLAKTLQEIQVKRLPPMPDPCDNGDEGKL